MASRIDEAEPLDYGNLAWLYVHLGNKRQAKHYVEQSLSQDKHNEHLLNLAQTLYL